MVVASLFGMLAGAAVARRGHGIVAPLPDGVAPLPPAVGVPARTSLEAWLLYCDPVPRLELTTVVHGGCERVFAASLDVDPHAHPALHLRRLTPHGIFETFAEQFQQVWDTVRPVESGG